MNESPSRGSSTLKCLSASTKNSDSQTLRCFKCHRSFTGLCVLGGLPRASTWPGTARQSGAEGGCSVKKGKEFVLKTFRPPTETPKHVSSAHHSSQGQQPQDRGKGLFHRFVVDLLRCTGSLISGDSF